MTSSNLSNSGSIEEVPLSIDEIVLQQVRQKLAEKRHEGIYTNKKNVHKCVRDYKEILCKSNKELPRRNPFPTSSNDNIDHHSDYSHNSSHELEWPTENFIAQEEHSKDCSSVNQDKRKELHCSGMSNETYNTSIPSFMRLSENSLMISNTKTISTHDSVINSDKFNSEEREWRRGREGKGNNSISKSGSFINNHNATLAEERLANMMLATVEEQKECENERWRLSRLSTSQRHSLRSGRPSSVVLVTNDANQRASMCVNNSQDKFHSETDVSARDKRYNKRVNIPCSSIRLSLNSHMNIEECSDTLLNSNDNVYPRKSYDTVDITNSATSIPTKKKKKKLPLNEHFVFPTSLDGSEGRSANTKKDNNMESHSLLDHSPPKKYSNSVSNYTNNTTITTTTNKHNNNKYNSSNFKTLSPRELSDAFYRKGSGGVMAAAAYAHFLQESKNNSINTKKNSDTNSNNNTNDNRKKDQSGRYSTCSNPSNNSKFDSIISTTTNTRTHSNRINTNKTLVRSKNDEQSESKENIRCTISENNDNWHSVITDTKNTNHKLQELLQQSNALFAQKSKRNTNINIASEHSLSAKESSINYVVDT